MALERLTIAQVAARYEVSTEVVRRRIRHGLLPAQRDNRGRWWVALDPDAPPPASLAPSRPPRGSRRAPRAPVSPPLSAPAAVEWVTLHERAAAAEGEAHGLREALRLAEAAAADARRRAEEAERLNMNAWDTAADFARQLAATRVPPTPAPPSPMLVRRFRWVGRLLGMKPA